MTCERPFYYRPMLCNVKRTSRGTNLGINTALFIFNTVGWIKIPFDHTSHDPGVFVFCLAHVLMHCQCWTLCSAQVSQHVQCYMPIWAEQILYRFGIFMWSLSAKIFWHIYLSRVLSEILQCFEANQVCNRLCWIRSSQKIVIRTKWLFGLWPNHAWLFTHVSMMI